MLINKVLNILKDAQPKVDEIQKIRFDNKTNTILVDINLGKAISIHTENENRLIISGNLIECELIKKILEKSL